MEYVEEKAKLRGLYTAKKGRTKDSVAVRNRQIGEGHDEVLVQAVTKCHV